MKIYERIKARRKELGISATDVAEALGISRATVYRYESADIKKLPTTIIEPLSKTLHCSIAYLMGLEESPNNSYKDDFMLSELEKNIMSKQKFNQLFSSNLNRYLENSNKTQADLAKYVGVSTASVSNWCNGVKLPRMDKVDKICAFFCIKRSDLMDAPSNPSKNNFYLSELEKNIIEKFRVLNDSERSMFLRSIGIHEAGKSENLA